MEDKGVPPFDWNEARIGATVFMLMTAVCLVSFVIGDYFMAMAERGGGGDFGALVGGLLGVIVFKFLSIPSFLYILVVMILFPFSVSWGWITHAWILFGLTALMYAPEGKRAVPKIIDTGATAYGYAKAIFSPTAKKLRPQKSDDHLEQEAETKELSTQLQDKLTEIERVKARINERQKTKQ